VAIDGEEVVVNGVGHRQQGRGGAPGGTVDVVELWEGRRREWEGGPAAGLGATADGEELL
jgi:hypothetical protein